MADSDITTTLPFVTRRRKDEIAVVADGLLDPATAGEPGRAAAADPAILLARVWRDAHARTLALCRLQQRLETRLAKTVDHPPCPSPGDPSDRVGGEESGLGYLHAKDAEAHAAEAEAQLLEELARTPAQTLDGVVAKLEVVVLEGKISDAPSSFPWPQLRSVLEDLSRIATPAPPLLSEARD